MDVEKNTKNKIIKIQKNVFDQNFTKNEFWGPKLQLSEPPRTRKHQKSCVNNNASIFQPKDPKTYWPFSYFCEPVRTIWHDPSIDLDLSCSYVFFWLHCDHFSVPNDRFCFFILFIFQIKSSPILTRARCADENALETYDWWWRAPPG